VPSPAIRAAAWIGALLLLVLHLDFWRPQRPTLYFGFLPEDLAWRIGWMILATLYLLFFIAFVWRSEE
jgi:hypothetical protein